MTAPERGTPTLALELTRCVRDCFRPPVTILRGQSGAGVNESLLVAAREADSRSEYRQGVVDGIDRDVPGADPLAQL
jgi:hypothetical protein